MQQVNELVQRAAAALVQLDTETRTLPHGYIASRVLERQEAVASSAIEGTHSTLDELLSVEAEQGQGAGPDAARVYRYALAMEAALRVVRGRGAAAFDVPFLQSLHRDLMTHDPAYGDEPGAFRSVVVWIGAAGRDIAYSTYNPTPPAHIATCMEEQSAYLQGGGMEQFLALPVRMAVAHAHFEAIHPFRDGNGRVGRLILPLMLAAEGHQPLYLAAFIEAHKDDYYAALRAAQQQLDFTPIIQLLARAIVASVHEVGVTREALIRLPPLWHARRRLRRDGAASRALALLSDWPVLTVEQLGALLGVSFQAANQAVRHLVEMGILRERTGHARNRLFVAEDVLRVINRPFGVAPLLPS